MLGKVALKVLFPAMLIDAFRTTLEDAEIFFNGVGVNFLLFQVHVLASGVMNALLFHTARFSADKGLIDLNVTTAATEERESARAHRLTNTVRHKTCSF